jgi:hypothetical protein
MEFFGRFVIEHQANILEVYTFKQQQKNVGLTDECYFHVLDVISFDIMKTKKNQLFYDSVQIKTAIESCRVQ